MAPLTFQVINGRLIEAPSWGQIERAFAKWETLRRGAFVLADSTNSYVQTAGADYKATVEYRQYLPDKSFAHFVLGHVCTEPVPTSIFSCVGTIDLYENEIFKLAEVLQIFHSFFDDRSVPSNLARQDITERFAPRS
jgi:hypothetical protein